MTRYGIAQACSSVRHVAMRDPSPSKSLGFSIEAAEVDEKHPLQSVNPDNNRAREGACLASRENMVSLTISAFLENETALKRFLGRMLPTQSDVEDVAQETFIRAFAASAKQTVEMPRAFLFRIAKNLALNERSRMWNTTTTFVGDAAELDDLGSNDEDVSGEDRLDSRRKLRLLEDAISQLPPQCRRVFQLRKIEDLSHKEIAAQMGISVSTVEKHIATGLVRCKKHLADRGYEVGSVSRPKLDENNGSMTCQLIRPPVSDQSSVPYNALLIQAYR